MCSDFSLRKWQAEILKQLENEDLATLALLILDGRDQKKVSRRILETLDVAIFRIWNRFAVKPKVKILQSVSVETRFDGIPRMECKVEKRGKWSEYFHQKDIDAIRDHDLDFILRFGFGIIRGEILNAARYGVWSYHHDDEREIRGTPPAFWSVFHGHATSGVILQRLTDRLDGGVILRRGLFPTGRSYAENLQRVYSGSISWVASAVRRIRLGDLSAVNADASPSTAKVHCMPSTLQMSVYGMKQIVRKIDFNVKNFFFHDIWNIGTSKINLSELLDHHENKQHTLTDITWAPTPEKGRYYADPFICKTGNGKEIIFEDYSYSRGGAIISRWSLDDTFAFVGHPRTAINSAKHLSYPYIFRAPDGRTICVPEVGAFGDLKYFDVTDGEFTECANLAQLGVIDPTIFADGGRWWMLGGLSGTGQYEVNGWYAESPFGPWTPHPLNPLKVDPYGTRPAGTPFRIGDRLYRPTQDCKGGYGMAIVIQEILALSPTRFEEVERARVVPDPASEYRNGTHHLAVFEDGIAFDGKAMRFSLWTPWLRLVNRLQRPFRKLETPVPSA